MNLGDFEDRIVASRVVSRRGYVDQYNSFWAWKTYVERDGEDHILDAQHHAETSRRLLGILPGWQTYRGVGCDYRRTLPASLRRVSEAYAEIRRHTILDFDRVREEPLRLIWHELGRIKEKPGDTREDSAHLVISICKPLMFLWGQTLAFDSANRRNIRSDRTIHFDTSIPLTGRWTLARWRTIMLGFQRELLRRPAIVSCCESVAGKVFGTAAPVPFGRFLDSYYY